MSAFYQTKLFALLMTSLTVPALLFAAELSPWQVEIVVSPDTVLKDVSDVPLGLAYSGRQSTGEEADALKRMGVRYLRGGDHRWSFWSEPPWEVTGKIAINRGTSAWPAKDREWVEPDGKTFRKDRFSDFDHFLDVTRSSKTSPLVILPYNAQAHIGSEPGIERPPLEDYVAAAEALIHYANGKRGAGIRYWEIGNEVWNREEGSVADPAIARDDLRLFAPRLRAADPSIRLMISGNSTPAWWRTLFEAAEHLDYVNVSDYLWDYAQGYDSFRLRTERYGSEATVSIRKALREVAPDHQDRIRLIVTEFNAYDWKESWPNTNDLGHALCVFQKAGDYLEEPFIHLAFFWASQWSWPPWSEPKDDEVSNAFRRDGSFTAIGSVLHIWASQLFDDMVAVRTSDPLVRAYATRSRDGTRLKLFFLNKDYRSATIALKMETLPAEWRITQRAEFSGADIADSKPHWVSKLEPSIPVPSELTISPTSITMVELVAPKTSR